MMPIHLCALLFLLLSPTTDSNVFGNKDVVALASTGLSAEIQVAKIKQADDVAFDLSVAGLTALTEAGIEESVIKAMLKRQSPPEVPQMPVEQIEDGIAWIRAETSDGALELPLEAGVIDQVGGGIFMPIPLFYLNYPGMRSPVRVSNRPSFIGVTTTAKRVPLFLVRLDPDG